VISDALPPDDAAVPSHAVRLFSHQEPEEMPESEDGGRAKRTKLDPVDHLRSLPVIRERCRVIYEVGGLGFSGLMKGLVAST
jgi:hypothetical protein